MDEEKLNNREATELGIQEVIFFGRILKYQPNILKVVLKSWQNCDERG